MVCFSRRVLGVVLLALSTAQLWSQNASREVRLCGKTGSIDVEMLSGNIVRVDIQPQGRKSPRTLVLDPDFKPTPAPGIKVRDDGRTIRIALPEITLSLDKSDLTAISITDAHGQVLVEQATPLTDAESRSASFAHASGEKLYGMRGISNLEKNNTFLRDGGATVAAGAQGDGGAPFFFTNRYGVLIDSDGGAFETKDGKVTFKDGSRSDIEYFVMVGEPMKVISSLARLSGLPQMPPKWTLGFLNSQWGSYQQEIEQLVATYRQKHIPIDGFILDADWKAWGEDDYGEWRWNGVQFPDAPSGEFAKKMQASGIQLSGILKPRILVYKKGGLDMNQAALYAQTRGLFYADEPVYVDYLSKRVTRDIDFGNPDAREWFWKHLQPAFDAGMIGWWNDEADFTGLTDDRTLYFHNLQFLNMGRALYEGQRAHSNLRVWSINRNYYLGAQRFGYAEWSGDTTTGFENMQREPVRMLSTLNLGEPHWSMDTGGFIGHPTPENYARWMEFGAFVPIFRVHGEFGEKRQPWVYGEKAEAAAARAIRLRYSFLPYIYSYEQIAHESGIGIVRPLFWEFPHDPQVANDASSWMFGDALLVSPVLTPNASVQKVYLPEGTWYDYSRGTRLTGGKTIDYNVDPASWDDIPLFVRAGSIVASQDPQDYVDQHPTAEVALDVFPGPAPARFVYYDDDGKTYDYEQNVYYRQPVSVSGDASVIHMQFERPEGSFTPALKTFAVRIHGKAARSVLVDGRPLTSVPEKGFAESNQLQWTNSSDRFGPVVILRVAALQSSSVSISTK